MASNDLPRADERDEPAPDQPRDDMADQAARLEQARAPDIEDQGEAAPDDIRQVDEDGRDIEAAPGQISKDDFWHVWQNAFAMPGLFLPPWKPLAIQPDEIEPGRAASDAAYEILEIYLPSALTPQGEMVQRLAVLVPFLIAKAQIARGIIAGMQAERIQARKAAAGQGAANRNAAPQFKSSRGPQQAAASNAAAGRYDFMDDERAG